MVNMDHLYSDSDWMLQAGLGDIEFEQDMYDDIVYGEPAHLPEWGRDQIRDKWPSNWEPLADYDELGLMGLRKHTMEGPMRYIYEDEQKKRRKKVYNVDGKEITGYLGQVDVDDPFDPDDNPRTRMDIDLKKILSIWDPSKGTLQDFISDVYRHEYKHPLYDPFLGIRENKRHWLTGADTGEVSFDNTVHAWNKFKKRHNINDPQHVPIHQTQVLYGKNAQLAQQSFQDLQDVPESGNRLGLTLIEHARRQNPHLNEKYNTGGIVSIVV